MLKKLILMNKHTPTMELECEVYDETGKIPKIAIKHAKLLNADLAPVSAFSKDEDLLIKQTQDWFDKRYLNKNRLEFLRKRASHLAAPTKNCYFASLTDQFYFQYDGETWEDISFFKNGIPQEYNTLFNFMNTDAIDELDNIVINWNTPDLCLNGLMNKRWVTKNGFVLEKYASFQQDPINELLASKILEQMNKKSCVRYRPVIGNYQYGCACDILINENEELVPAWQIMSRHQNTSDSYYIQLKSECDKLNIPGVGAFIDEIIEVDNIIGNNDRNAGNICFKRDVNTGKFIGPAKIFDYGAAFKLKPDSLKQCRDDIVKSIFADRERELLRGNKIVAINPKRYIDLFAKADLLTEENKQRIWKSFETLQAFNMERINENRDMNENDDYINNYF